MSVSIAQIAEQDRPRERLDRLGPRALADGELVALVLRSGGPECNALTLGQALLAEYGGLHALAEAGNHELAGVTAMGPAKASSLVAAFELGRRAAELTGRRTVRIRDAGDIAAVARRNVTDPSREECFVVVLSASHRVLRVQPLTIGTDKHCLLDNRDVLTAVLRHGGAAFALVHTHPSGEARPSPEDHSITESLVRATETVGLVMIDHIILAGSQWCSVTK